MAPGWRNGGGPAWSPLRRPDFPGGGRPVALAAMRCIAGQSKAAATHHKPTNPGGDMTKEILKRIGAAACAIACLLAGGPAFAQDFPSAKPIRLVTPLPAGSATDAVARIVSKAAAEVLGQQFIVENKAGADGAIAALEVMRAPADGYTLLLGTHSQLSEIGRAHG